MAVGLLHLNIYIPNINSLKEKRSVLKRLFSQLKKSFNIAVAETDKNDLWRHSVIEIVTVSNTRKHCEEVLTIVLHRVEGTIGADVCDFKIEYL